MLNRWSRYHILPSIYAFYPTRTYLTQPQPLERIVGTDNRAFNMICSGALQKILQR